MDTGLSAQTGGGVADYKEIDSSIVGFVLFMGFCRAAQEVMHSLVIINRKKHVSGSTVIFKNMLVYLRMLE